MRKFFGIAALVVALAVPSTALAAILSKGQGSSCNGDGVWRFVNRQTGGAADPGSLVVFFTNGITVTTGPSVVGQSRQEFIVQTTGDFTLLTAETDLPGTLVLKRLTCS